MDTECNENINPSTSSICRLDSLIFGYLSRQQYTKTVSALLEESPILKKSAGKLGNGRGVFIHINPTLCDKNLEYIVETFAHYGRFDLSPEFIEFGNQLRKLTNEYSQMTSVRGSARSENHRKMYGGRSRSKNVFNRVSTEGNNRSQTTSGQGAVFPINQHPLTVYSSTPSSPAQNNIVYSNRPIQPLDNQLINNPQGNHLEHNSLIPKSCSSSALLSSAVCSQNEEYMETQDIPSSVNNLDPPVQSMNDEHDSHMHSILSDEGSSRRKRHQPHSFSERFVSKLADAASKSKQCKEKQTVELSSLDIGDEIYDLFDIRNLPSQLEEVVCRFDPEDRFFDYAGFMEMDEPVDHPADFDTHTFVDPSLNDEHLMHCSSPIKTSSSQAELIPPMHPISSMGPIPPIPNMSSPVEANPPPIMIQQPISAIIETPIPQPNRSYVMKGPRNVPKKTPKPLSERSGIKDATFFEAKNVPLREHAPTSSNTYQRPSSKAEKITMGSLFDDDSGASSDNIDVREKDKRSRSPDIRSRKEPHREESRSKQRDVHSKEKKMEKSSSSQREKMREDRDDKRSKFDKEDSEKRKHLEKKISKSDRSEDRKKIERHREEEKRNSEKEERKKKESLIKSHREQEQLRREEAMKRREEEKRRALIERRKLQDSREEDRQKSKEEEARRPHEEQEPLIEIDRSDRENHDGKSREDIVRKKRSKEEKMTNSSSKQDIFGAIEKNFDSLRRPDESISPEISFLPVKKLAPSTKIPKKGTESASSSPAPERHSVPPPSSANSSSSSTSSLPPYVPSPTLSAPPPPLPTSAPPTISLGIPSNEPNLLIRSTVNDARIGLQFESASLKWKMSGDTSVRASSSTAPEKPCDPTSDARKRSLIDLGKLLPGSSSPKDSSKKKIKLDFTDIQTIMRKVHGESGSSS